MTEREVPDGALPLRQGVRSVEAGLGVPDSRQCQGHLCAPSVVLPFSFPESTCCDGCQCQADSPCLKKKDNFFSLSFYMFFVFPVSFLCLFVCFLYEKIIIFMIVSVSSPYISSKIDDFSTLEGFLKEKKSVYGNP